jgi:small-conductance mechanosensitive channel
VISPPPAVAAPAPAPARPSASPAGAARAPEAFDPKRAQAALAQIQNQIAQASSDAALTRLGDQVARIENAANRVVAAQTQQLFHVDTALKRYDFTRRRPGSAAEHKARAALHVERGQIQAKLTPAQQVASAASTTYSQIAERLRSGFSARVLARSPSPLTPAFWSALAVEAHADADRLAALAQQALTVAIQAPEPQAGLVLIACIVVNLLMLVPGRRLLLWVLRRKAAPGEPGLAHIAAAAWRVVVDTGLPTLAAILLRLAAQWAQLLSPEVDALAGAVVAAVAWSAAILALGRAMAADPDRGHRLLAISDEAAARLRVGLWAVAVITGVGFVLTRLNYIIGASLPATIALNCLVSLAYAAVAGLIVVSFSRGRRAGLAVDVEVRSPAWTLISLTFSAAIIITVGAVFVGYSTLAALVSNQIFWLSLIAAVTYLLLRLIDETCDTLFRPHGWASRTLTGVFNLRSSSVRQMGLLIAAALQLLVLIGALSLALTPFGQSGDLLFARVGQLGGAVRIGTATISPAAIATGIATFGIGMALVHFARGWLVRRYLPVTDWDAGLRNSVATGVGYLGVAVAFLCAFAASGLGMAQIALVASALSVGVGFGLQQVVQNLAAGVILLIERPVKVGDWVSVGGVEGDIRRIRVRATEIQTGDRSTVIVPNSDLITKQVQNKTLGEPRGAVTFQIPVGNAADALRAPALILAAAKDHREVLDDPPPAVMIDSLGAGGVVNLACSMAVAGPRAAYRIRSELYFAILAAFQREAIALVPFAAVPPAPPPAPAPKERVGTS